ncbi:MAG: glycoside hydrolase family 2 protein [Gemmatimonadetes bacterium]|nr:glycoside hydrolase family 2 protein [Gemmatimonadota bacterium]
MRPGARLVLVAAAVSAAACAAPEPALLTRTLDSGWQLQKVGDSTWISAKVPGTVHTDLFAAGLIPDPFVGARESELQWIEDADWTYRTEIDADARLLSQEHVELVFEGLDTYADVRLNGETVLTADNMFRRWRVDVKSRLHPGANTLEVRFTSPVRVGAERAAASPWPIPHQEPDARNTRAFTRKAAYQYGWDWGPRYVTSGIWLPARLEAWSGSRIRDVRVRTESIGPREAQVLVDVEIQSSRAGGVRVGARSPDGSFESVLEGAGARAGLDTVQLQLSIPEPKLWWPRNLGDAHLYSVDVDLTREKRWDRRQVRFGVRTIALDTTADTVADPGGAAEVTEGTSPAGADRAADERTATRPAHFTFVVNGVPFFARGANLVPPDHFLPRVDSAAWERLLGDAAAANMNMLRVWGGGAYLPDVFYDLADRMGIMVWQDFMFANAMVPGDSAFVASVAAEARDHVRRLRDHPSLALWCGNNEIAEAWGAWGWQDDYTPAVRKEVAAAYARIFDDVLPATVRTHDPATPYWPASPPVSWGRPEALVRGDSHYWGVWHGREPFRAYAVKVPRFASEFGFQGLPAPATVEAFDSVAPATLDDPGMRAHQKFLGGGVNGYDMIRMYMEREGWPTPPSDSVDAFAYVSQLQQAEGVGLALEAHRRSWPHTAGSLYWQLDDSWPVVSWSGRDYFGRWKALHYKARAVFAPVTILADTWADTVHVWAMADTGRVEGVVEVRSVDMTGDSTQVRVTIPVTLEGGAAPLTWSWPVDSLLGGSSRRATVIEARLLDASIRIARDLAFAVVPDSLELPDPGVHIVSAEPAGNAWKVTVTAHRFAFGVRLTVEGVGARFSDDYFDLLPGESEILIVTPDRPTPDLPDRLRLRTLEGITGT